MKVLLVNKYYYPRGGDCIVTLNTQKMLEDRGHEVGIFAMQHPNNLPTKWSKYFPKEVEFAGKNPKNLIGAALRIFGVGVKRKFEALLDDFNPDVVHMHNIHSQLSPIVARIAKERGICVVWTMHDYKAICPRYDCTRGKQPCMECSQKPFNVVKYRCNKGSLVASLLGYFESRYWDKNRLLDWVDVIICPSRFMADRLIENGIEKLKINALCNFIPQERLTVVEVTQTDDSYCYVGRISEEKGVKTLLEVASGVERNIDVVGEGPLLNELKEKYRDYPCIRFHGHQDWISISKIVQQSKFMVVPSEWFENNPLSIIESISLGTPVLGANIGGIPELIADGVTGLLFESGDKESLKNQIAEMFGQSFERENIKKQANRLFSEEKHYRQLVEWYKKS